MGIDNYLDEIKEEVQALDDDEIKDVRDRVAMIERVTVAQDKHIEELEQKIETLEMKVDNIKDTGDNKWK